MSWTNVSSGMICIRVCARDVRLTAVVRGRSCGWRSSNKRCVMVLKVSALGLGCPGAVLGDEIIAEGRI